MRAKAGPSERVHRGLDSLLFGLGVFPFDFGSSLIFLGQPPGADGGLAYALIQAELFRSSCIIPSSDIFILLKSPKYLEKEKMGGESRDCLGFSEGARTGLLVT